MLELMGPEPFDTGQMIFMDPLDHTRLRALVSRAFTPRRVDALEDRIRELSCNLLDRSFDLHVSFGYGIHFCLGAALARRVVRLHTSTVRGFAQVPLRV